MRVSEGTVIVTGATRGIGRATVDAILDQGGRVVAIARDADALAALEQAQPDRVRALPADLEDVASVDVVVNTTAVGMAGGPAPDGLPIPVEGLGTNHLVIDVVYQPRVTPLLAAARAAGAATDGGVAMLIGQAALAFELWTGIAAPVEAMTAAVVAADAAS